MNVHNFNIDACFIPEFCISIIVLLAWLHCPRRSKKHTVGLDSQRENVHSGAPSQSISCDAPRFQADINEKARQTEHLHQLAKDGNLKELVRVFRDMEKRFPDLLNAEDYHCVIVNTSRGGDPGTALEWLQRCMKAGIRPLCGSFNTVIHSCAVKGSFTEALGVTREMQSAGVEPNTVTYNTVIDVWRRMRNPENAQVWMKKLLATRLQPNVISFGTVMLACAQAGLIEDLEKWFTLSQKHKFQFDSKMLCPVVSALARKVDVKNTMRWFRIMVEHGVRPPVHCCAQVLNAIAQSEDVEQAAALINQMRAAGVQPDGGFMSQCVVLACNKNLSSKAQTWAEECVAENRVLTWTARQAMIQAGLLVPEPTTGMFEASGRRETLCSRDVHVTGAGENASGPLDALSPVDVGRVESIEAARKAAIGKRYCGVVKDFVPGKFGYITCPAIFEIFQKDVFLGRYANPEQLTKGHRVSFTLRVDEAVGLPRAFEVTAVEKAL